MELPNLNPRISTALKRSRLKPASVRALLSYSIGDLQRLAQLTADEAAQAVRAASQVCAVPPQTALALAKCRSTWNDAAITVLSTACPVLDDFLHGGLPTGGLVEVCGESSAGKTQMCLQLCMSAQMPRSKRGLSGSAVYVSTEDVFPHKRMAQLAKLFPRRMERMFCEKSSGWLAGELMDNIFVEHALTLDDLEVFVERRLPELVKRHGVRLVVVDSVAALARAEFSRGQEGERARVLGQFASGLRRVSRQHGVAVVLVNQVTAVLDGCNSLRPALGMAWSDAILVRLLLTRRRLTLSDDSSNQTAACTDVPRRLQVLLAPHLPPDEISFVVDESGVTGLPVAAYVNR